MDEKTMLRPNPTCVLLLAMLATALPRTQAAELTMDTLFGPDLHGEVPEELAWRPGSRQLLYLWDDGSGPAYRLLDAESGESVRLARPAELGAEGDDEVEDLAFDPSGDSLLYLVSGDIHRFDLESRKAHRLRETAADEEDPKLSPDGESLAYVRDDELYLLDLASGKEKRLTHDGDPGVVVNGTTDWVYWEEIWSRDSTGFWWSADSRRIAFYHFDDTEVPIYPLVDTRPLHPEIDRQRYPKAGDVLPRVEIRVLEVAGGGVVKLATGDDPDVYLARVHWHPDAEKIAVERLAREQNQLDLLLCDAATGACETLLSERWPTWVNLGDEFTFLDDGRFLWSSEKSGSRQLYLHAADGGELRRLTPEGQAVTALDAVHEEAGRFVYTAYSTAELGAAERHVFVGKLAGGEPRRLTDAAGWNTAAAIAETGWWVLEHSDVDTPPNLELRHLETAAVGPLPYTPPTSYDPAALPRWQRLTVPGPEGSRLPAQILKPQGFDPTRKYPVIMYHYGCPASQVVSNRWRSGRRRQLWHKLLATRGYVVFSVDNQASSFFGKAGEDRLYRRFGDLEHAAQLAGVEYLKSQPWVDAERIGLWGWSGGGSNTLYSLFAQPGTWAAGIAGAPVTDWRFYDAIWVERYLDRPQDNPEGYDASAPLTYAEKLRDPLLVIHGTADNNVHPQNTLNLIAGFIEAGVPFELALYPNVRHSPQTFSDAGQRHLFEKMTAFFDQHLGER